MNDTSTTTEKQVSVTIVSIGSKDPMDLKRKNNVVYTVDVPADQSIEYTLESAFVATNQDNRPLSRQVCSTTSGDIMIYDGSHYLVESGGFKSLTLAESQQIQKLTSRDTSFGYDFMVKHNIIAPV